MSHRIEKVNKLLKQQVGVLIHQKFAHSLGIISINSVISSGDLKSAKIYISSLNDDKIKEIAETLQKNSVFFEKELKKIMTVRYIPKLEFIVDESLEEISRVEELLSKINQE